MSELFFPLDAWGTKIKPKVLFSLLLTFAVFAAVLNSSVWIED